MSKRISRAKAAGRLVDVYCDASKRGLDGAWAAVVVREDRPSVEASGALRGWTATSEIAELRAAGNALHAAARAGLLKAGDLAVIRSDNLSNVRRIQLARLSRRTRERNANGADVVAAFDWIFGFAAAEGFEVTAAHVKGHQPADSVDPHAVHNRRCDLLCKRVTGAKGGRAPVGIEEERRARAVQSSRARAASARRAIEAAEKLAGRQ